MNAARNVFFAVIICLALLPGCCNDEECACLPESNLPVTIGPQQPLEYYYWLRLDPDGALLDSAKVNFPPRSNSVGPTNWGALNEAFPYVQNFETYTYVLSNRQIPVTDTFSNFVIRHTSTDFTCCRKDFSCPGVEYLQFSYNGQPLDTSDFPFFVTLDP